MRAVLIATYEMGRQPFGLASPAAWLRDAGARVTCADLSREPLPVEALRQADLVAFHVPMHTATRLALELIEPVRELNPRAHLCFYGLYAPVNETYLRKLGVGSILGGEFEDGLVSLMQRLSAASWTNANRAVCHPERSEGPAFEKPPGQGQADSSGPKTALGMTGEARQPEPVVSLARLKFITPDRAGMAPLRQYARVVLPGGEHRTVGYTEASRGCKHLCRHCPIVPVYNGVFRIVPRDVVLQDIRRQVAAGAGHITFGDPDFFNGPGHAVEIIEALHRAHPRVTYDVTIKVEHLLKHAALLPRLRDTGCLFVTTAVETVDDAVLERLDKGHTRADFLRVVDLCREARLVLQPTFVPFTPWTTLDGYLELLELLVSLGLVEHVAPIQLAIRLLIPAGSKLLDLAEVRGMVAPFDEAALVYPWAHADPRVDALCQGMQEIVRRSELQKRSRVRTFERMRESAGAAAGKAPLRAMPPLAARAAVPYLNEPWYC